MKCLEYEVLAKSQFKCSHTRDNRTLRCNRLCDWAACMLHVHTENPTFLGVFSNSVLHNIASKAFKTTALKIHAPRLENVRASVMIRSDVIEHKMWDQGCNLIHNLISVCDKHVCVCLCSNPALM